MHTPDFTSTPHHFTRREMLRTTGLAAVALTLGPWANHPATAAESAKAVTAVPPLNRFPRMVQEYFVEQVRRAEARGLHRKNALKSKADAEEYVREVQKKIRFCFGPWPEKTPLNARVTGKVERDAYVIEKVIFESRPNFPVTANLYVPKGRAFPLPGVVGTCGHSANGKAVEPYQSFAQGLARQGYIVLIYDPIGQGERFQYTDDKLKSTVGAGVPEHLLAGNQQFLVGEFLGSWRTWDGIRALDYLLTRPEVDPKQVGVTGNSGGGTMTAWLCGNETRWSMAAPSCFVTTFRHNVENELPADTEQCPPRALALALDHDDFIAAMAPKPVILMSQEKDFFDTRGTAEAYERLRRLYQLLGAEENIHLFVGPTYHGYSKENREAMYQWFNHVTKVSQAASEPALTIEKDETLWCTPNGRVAELKPRTIMSFTREAAQTLAKSRPRLSGADLREAITEVLKLPARNGVPDYRILRPVPGRKFPAKQFGIYVVETEPGIQAVVYRLSDGQLLSRLPRGQKRAVLYVSHHSADAELREEPLLKEILQAEPDSAFFTCDVRGIGESKPDTCDYNSFLTAYGSDFFYAIHSLMLDYPYPGQKTFDVLRVLDLLASTGHEEIHLVGKGWGAIPATFAALLHDRVTQVTLKNGLTSYTDIAEAETYKWPLSTLLPSVLKKFDLPDCYRELETKKLRQIDPLGASAS